MLCLWAQRPAGGTKATDVIVGGSWAGQAVAIDMRSGGGPIGSVTGGWSRHTGEFTQRRCGQFCNDEGVSLELLAWIDETGQHYDHLPIQLGGFDYRGTLINLRVLSRHDLKTKVLER